MASETTMIVANEWNGWNFVENDEDWLALSAKLKRDKEEAEEKKKRFKAKLVISKVHFSAPTRIFNLMGSMEKKNNEFATAARDMIFSGGIAEDKAADSDGGAIDEGDADEEMVNSKRNFSQLRIQKRNSEAGLLKKVIPFHWAPMLQPLTENDIDTCVTLESVALSEARYRSPREKIEYRIRKSGGICYGLFNTVKPSDVKNLSITTMQHSRFVEGGRGDQSKHVMFAHVLATLGTHTVVTDADMAMPENWRDAKGVGIGKTVMKSYLELMNESGMADRIAIICQPYAIQFYKCFGFKDLGPSTEALVGQGWHAMVLELRGPKRKTKEEPTKPSKEDAKKKGKEELTQSKAKKSP
ncbi:hypothetical protein FSARC_12300 [Fusarium sarcochroum]|uniref:N-acetyltransferase domain-containing protein n=1 Tax=Fusarium sarcochroum TaxID=1208366 RepID=A0A8H4T9M4_9HYPO|nr:hypothetical protein FSARC_12300 [Fusarium sarcochroum]